MTARHFETGWGNPASYSSAVRHGNLVFVAGQLGLDFVQGGGPYEVVPGTPTDFASQCELALRRMIAAVEAAGGGLETILRIGGYVDPSESMVEYDAIFRRIVTVDPKPVRTTIYVGKFGGPILVEVDAVAYVRGTGGS